MGAPVHRMKKTDIVKLAKWRCEHNHDGLEHYSCWVKHHPDTERCGYLDIESSNLHANWGIVLTYVIKVRGEDTFYQKTITAKELKDCLDRKVMEQCLKDLGEFDRIYTYYGTGFDVKFLRTRAITVGLEFPEYGTLFHNDVYYMARNRLCLNSNRLDTVCTALFGETTKTRLTPKYWTRALMGDKESLAYIAEHCRQDTIELERVHNALIGFSKQNDTSL